MVVLLFVAVATTGFFLSAGSGGGTGPVSLSLGEHLQWDGEVPPLVHPGDRELLLGRYRLLEDSESVLYVGVWDAETRERLWHSAALGTLGEGAQLHVHMALGGELALYTDGWKTLHVRDLVTGEDRGEHTLSDRSTGLCVVAPGSVWVAVADEQHVLIDLASGTSRPAPRPARCPDPLRNLRSACVGSPMGGAGPKAPCEDGGREVEAGMKVDFVLWGDQEAFVFGVRNPGTATPLVARRGGWQRVPSEAEPRLLATKPPQTADIVSGDPVLLLAMTDKTHRLVRLDAGDGHTIYEVTVPRSDDGSFSGAMSWSTGRIYVPHWTWLEVFDAATGEHEGTIGRW